MSSARTATCLDSPRPFQALPEPHFVIYTPGLLRQKEHVLKNRSDTQVKFAALNTSIVVLAEAHNPSILHPAFLAAQHIVPPDWQPAEPPVSSPAISIVKYTSGITFLAELNKLMVRDDAPTDHSPVPDLVAKYVEHLPHVHYSAVGVNTSGFIECPNPERWVVERFLKTGPGNDQELSPTSAAVKLIYPVEAGTLILSCDAGNLQKPGDKADHPCLLINGNYHTSISGGDAVRQVLATVSLYGKRLAHFARMTDIIFELETKPCSA